MRWLLVLVLAAVVTPAGACPVPEPIAFPWSTSLPPNPTLLVRAGAQVLDADGRPMRIQRHERIGRDYQRITVLARSGTFVVSGRSRWALAQRYTIANHFEPTASLRPAEAWFVFSSNALYYRFDDSTERVVAWRQVIPTGTVERVHALFPDGVERLIFDNGPVELVRFEPAPVGRPKESHRAPPVLAVALLLAAAWLAGRCHARAREPA